MVAKKTLGVALWTALAVTLMGNGGPITANPEITVRYGNRHVSYDHKQLQAMATTKLTSMRGTKEKPAIPLEDLLVKDTGIELDQIKTVIVVGDGMPAALRGDDLEHLDKLVLASGDDKGKFGHPWALAPEDTDTWKELRGHLGSRRKHGVSRIDIHLKQAKKD